MVSECEATFVDEAHDAGISSDMVRGAQQGSQQEAQRQQHGESSIDTEADEVRCFIDTKGRPYWYNCATKSVMWNDPTEGKVPPVQYVRPPDSNWSPIVLKEEYVYCCDPSSWCCGVYCCENCSIFPLCCLSNPDSSFHNEVSFAHGKGLLGPGQAVLSYRLEHQECGRFQTTKMFRNAEAVDRYHDALSSGEGDCCCRLYHFCEMLSLPFRVCFGPRRVYGDPYECTKCKTPIVREASEEEGTLRPLVKDDRSMSQLVARFGALHYGWVEAPSLAPVEWEAGDAMLQGAKKEGERRHQLQMEAAHGDMSLEPFSPASPVAGSPACA